MGSGFSGRVTKPTHWGSGGVGITRIPPCRYVAQVGSRGARAGLVVEVSHEQAHHGAGLRHLRA